MQRFRLTMPRDRAAAIAVARILNANAVRIDCEGYGQCSADVWSVLTHALFDIPGCYWHYV
jgi:hypothetical protein